jgi:predicted nucleotidyltransferase
MPTALDLTPQEIAAYRAAAQRRHQQAQQELALREQKAWQLARRAADLLRAQFGATRVIVFGSLVHPGCFTPWSDVDIAAWGIQPADTFRAIGAVMDLDDDDHDVYLEIEINLVDVGACTPSLLETIERDGVEL